jgi:rare lipoprotein A (peptidoglycan hydrolase)
VRTKVVDRGPYAAGVDYDLTWAAARKLGVISIGRATVRASR